jgi:hypothetical protein
VQALYLAEGAQCEASSMKNALHLVNQTCDRSSRGKAEDPSCPEQWTGTGIHKDYLILAIARRPVTLCRFQNANLG